jgi:hypothetical protein
MDQAALLPYKEIMCTRLNAKVILLFVARRTLGKKRKRRKGREGREGRESG